MDEHSSFANSLTYLTPAEIEGDLKNLPASWITQATVMSTGLRLAAMPLSTFPKSTTTLIEVPAHSPANLEGNVYVVVSSSESAEEVFASQRYSYLAVILSWPTS